MEKKKIPDSWGKGSPEVLRRLRHRTGGHDPGPLSFHWFDPEQSFVSDSRGQGKGGRAAAAALRRLGPFQVPTLRRRAGRILLPVAIHACADLMDLFYPTLELRAEYEEIESEMEGSIPGPRRYGS